MAEMKELESEIGVDLLPKQRLVRLEANVAPGVEVEIGEAVGQRRNGGVVGRRRQIVCALHDVLVAERRRASRAALRRVCLSGRVGDEASARGGEGAGDERAA